MRFIIFSFLNHSRIYGTVYINQRDYIYNNLSPKKCSKFCTHWSSRHWFFSVLKDFLVKKRKTQTEQEIGNTTRNPTTEIKI